MLEVTISYLILFFHSISPFGFFFFFAVSFLIHFRMWEAGPI